MDSGFYAQCMCKIHTCVYEEFMLCAQNACSLYEEQVQNTHIRVLRTEHKFALRTFKLIPWCGTVKIARNPVIQK